ncbi:hypothetical protein CHL78_005540 [Romboutsia weinsteinii]|uniref:Putative host cell surface-exposed lipoprotein Ltp-like HTH region domain-containing protein n=2 Tax=Romboutsia weinsteinii TaxID=2020949 RepID=A0A371J6Y7_9FIRM|nr:hypothetical protein CHL78_005540 [Romboutsia weinsteinii]
MKHKVLTGILVLILFGAIGSMGDDTTSEDGTIQTSTTNNEQIENNNDTPGAEKNIEDDVPTEYKSALRKAKTYSDTMSMSKAGLYEQLTSEYGEKFTVEAAQYAIDNVVADWNKNALEKAKTYQESMAMSPSAIYDQLTSEHGEKFTAEEAQYAIDNLE